MSLALQLDARLQELARVPVLLVASDFDGTLSPLVDEPAAARPDREAIVALRRLASLANTHVGVVSGRALSELAHLTRLPQQVHLVGSHGSEFDADFTGALSAPQLEQRAYLVAELRRLADRHEGFRLEEKPAGAAFHYRMAPDDEAKRALVAIEQGITRRDGIFTKHGKKVVELSVVATDKGDALEKMRQLLGPSAVVFLGDDITDEDAFRTLRGPDLGVKVGDGPSEAALSVPNPRAVAEVLGRLCELRSRWLTGAGTAPIEQHVLLSDQRALALVDPLGRIVWLCLPRLDSPALFAQLVGGPTAGRFDIRPEAGRVPQQRYRPGSMVLETVWPFLVLTDFLDCSGSRPRRRPGRSELVRILAGEGPVEIEFAPRLDFGRTPTRIKRHENGLEVEDWIDPIVLYSLGVDWHVAREGHHDVARGRVVLQPEEPLALELRFGTGSLHGSRQSVLDRAHVTDRYWTSWAEQLDVPASRAPLLRRSALVLKALCHGPSGAIAAAATTSLPECIGGVRNWDYRFCWLRDAAMAADALVRLGSQREAMRFLDWVLGIVERVESPTRLKPVYTVSGGDVPSEAEISELSGYAGSRPVRVGNLAANQLQLDVYGYVVRLVHRLVQRGAPISSEHWRLTEAMIEAVAQRWREPDHGLWEVRLVRRHYVHSKVMCWLAVQCGIEIAEHMLGRRHGDWESLRDEIAADVLEHGWDSAGRTFTGAYESSDLDAAVLSIGLSGLLPPTDERFTSTVEAVERNLREGPMVYRYLGDDGLPGREGGWFLCTGWLIEAYALMGRAEDSASLLRDMLACFGPTGLAPEQHDPEAGVGLGNHPQAYSHIALINSVLCQPAD